MRHGAPDIPAATEPAFAAPDAGAGAAPVVAAPVTAPPGWYPAGGTTQLRYWDGNAWTSHVSPAPAPAFTVGPTSDDGPSTALHWIVPVGRSWQSIAAGYLGLLVLIFPFAAFASIPMGIWALRLAAHGGHGRGRAWFGIIMGVLGLLLLLIVLIQDLRS